MTSSPPMSLAGPPVGPGPRSGPPAQNAPPGGYPARPGIAPAVGYSAPAPDAPAASYPAPAPDAPAASYPAQPAPDAPAVGYPAQPGADPASPPAGPGYPDQASPDAGPGYPDQASLPAEPGYPAQASPDAGPGYPDQAGYGAPAGETGQQDDPWPHQSYLELGSLPTAVSCARLHTALVLWEWRLAVLSDTATLIVSELVTNAVQASAPLTGSRFAGRWAPGVPPVRLWLSADQSRVVVQVWDSSHIQPALRPMAPEAASGRGLLLVSTLSAEWGCYTPEKSSGKVVWAVVTE